MFHPIQINHENIPNPISWTENYAPVVKENQLESGNTQIIYVGWPKFSASGTWNCSSTWANKFQQFAELPEVSVGIYDPSLGGYDPILSRIKDFSKKLIENSAYTSGTEGLWEVSFSIVQY